MEPRGPLFLPSRSYRPRHEGCRPRHGSSVLQPSTVVVGVRTQTGATIGRTLPSGLCKCPEDRRAIERDLPSAFDVCHVTADSTNEPPSAVLSPLITRHPSPQGRSLIPSVPYLCIPSPVLCSPYDSLILDDSCLSLPCCRSPPFPCRHPSLRETRQDWHTRPHGSPESPIPARAHTAVPSTTSPSITFQSVLDIQRPRPDPPCASPIYAQPSQPLTRTNNPTARSQGRIPIPSWPYLCS